jgi:hypothetical protein
MFGVIKDVCKIFKKNNYKNITIAEVTHNSYDSHTFQYNLLKELLKNNLINAISSERMGNFDALLINLWLNNTIKCSQNKLFSKILPFGGLGTFRWIKYIKKMNLKIKIIPSEKDDLSYVEMYKPYFISTIKNICSKSFGNSINYATLRDKKIIHAKKFIKTNIDKLCYKFFSCAFGDSDRYEYWIKNLTINCNSKTKLFINGYHLWNANSNSVIGKKIENILGKTLYLGMGSSYIERETITYPYKLDKNININNYIGSKKFKKQINKYMNDLYDADKLEKNIKIKNISRYFGLTDLEKTNSNKYSLVNTSGINEFIKIDGVGVTPIAKISKTALKKNIQNFVINVKVFDYVVFIPKSTLNNKMYM